MRLNKKVKIIAMMKTAMRMKMRMTRKLARKIARKLATKMTTTKTKTTMIVMVMKIARQVILPWIMNTLVAQKVTRLMKKEKKEIKN